MKGVHDIYLRTPAQAGILFDYLRDPNPEPFFEQVRCELVGPVDIAELRDAFCETDDAHPARRTIWLWEVDCP